VCALVALRPGEFDEGMMCLDAARAMGAKRLYLETNHALLPAIHLYQAVGFTHLPKERVVASPYARADVFMEMWLKRGGLWSVDR
jgi:putative acetyltransferase